MESDLEVKFHKLVSIMSSMHIKALLSCLLRQRSYSMNTIYTKSNIKKSRSRQKEKNQEKARSRHNDLGQLNGAAEEPNEPVGSQEAQEEEEEDMMCRPCVEEEE